MSHHVTPATSVPARFEGTMRQDLRAFRKAIPFESQAIHVRWSGEGVWMPLGDLDFGVSYETTPAIPGPAKSFLSRRHQRTEICWRMARAFRQQDGPSSREISLPTSGWRTCRAGKDRAVEGRAESPLREA